MRSQLGSQDQPGSHSSLCSPARSLRALAGRRRRAMPGNPGTSQDRLHQHILRSVLPMRATQMDNGIKLYLKTFGDTVAGKKIEIIRKDTGGANPDVAKRLAQELIVRDGVDILAGFALTPNAARGRRRLGAGQEADDHHERGDLDHHHQVALMRCASPSPRRK